jgi:RNA polymerase sigma factor (sigma-70 family)
MRDTGQEEFQAWWEQYRHQLYNVALRWCQDPATAEDILQTVALMCLEQSEDWPHDRETIERLARLIRWRAFDLYRHERRRVEREDRWWAEILQRDAYDDIPEAIDSADLSMSPQWREVEAAIVSLPTTQRAVIRYDLAGYSTEAIAKRLRIKATTVRSLRRHAMFSIRESVVPANHD